MIRQARFDESDRSMTKDMYQPYSPSRSLNNSLHDYNNNPKDSEELLHDEVRVLDGLNDRLMEKLARTESRLEAARMHNDEVSLETEAKIAAKGAGRFDFVLKTLFISMAVAMLPAL